MEEINLKIEKHTKTTASESELSTSQRSPSRIDLKEDQQDNH